LQTGRAIEIIERQRTAISSLRNSDRDDAMFSKWKRDTEIAIQRIFSPGSRNIDDFKKISYILAIWTDRTTDQDIARAYFRGLDEADAILSSMVDEIRDYGFLESTTEIFGDQIKIIELICMRFHTISRTLQNRYANRTTLIINDEYDVQDLLHAVLKLHFDDIRPEEWTPSYAGSASRVDFLLKKERIIIEVKKTRASLKIGELGEQLIIDRARYEHHPDCDTLICFIYDADGRIGNPAGLERDLEKYGGTLKMRVIIAPKS
jgi:hypothetical protein